MYSAVIIERMLNAPQKLVYEAWTNPEYLTQWWTPFGFTAEVVEFNPIPNGKIHIRLTDPDNNQYFAKGIFLELSPIDLIYIRGQAPNTDACGAGLPPDAVIKILLKPVGEKTQLTIDTQFIDESAKSAAQDAGYNQGWGSALDFLEKFLAVR